MALTDLMVDSGPDMYYDPAFRKVLEDHMTLLRDRYSTIVIVSPGDAWQWRNDLFGFLASRNEPRHMHWVIMRLNQWTSKTQFDENISAILKPDYTKIEQILQSHNASGRIS